MFILLLVINMAILLAATIIALTNLSNVKDNFMWGFALKELDESIKKIIVISVSSVILLI